MFAPGEVQPNDRARRLLAAISQTISQLPNRVTISGHTGSTPSINGTHEFTALTTTTGTIPVSVTVGGTGGTLQK